MDAKSWRTLALFVAAIAALAFFNPTAAMLAAGTVFLVILFRNVPMLQASEQGH